MKSGLKKMGIEKTMNLILKILLALKMAPKDKDLQEIYNRIFADAMKYTDQFNVQMVAATCSRAPSREWGLTRAHPPR